ncbi:Inosine/uridine-preferring nucleoside hydrolase domain-containing protein [Collybia nuda]|uniref:Inosine/uridine-preferring nucleoside hydrolase domain-containing protein n=1 Tax=Collybia nuda TaxID=64659 RepID=A0A9P6CI79_9AGAR|nr:Inosine/uridine-preferring nucleoside hydrolase domain-containing protein [Collybia nuda]
MASTERIPVIIDTDPGVDDTIAILLALASPELEILAFIVSFGNTDIESSYRNILKTYKALDRHFEQYPSHKDRFPNFLSLRKPILAKGSCGPLEGELHSAQYFHGRDGLSGITDRHPDLDTEKPEPRGTHPQLELTDRSGVDVALDLLRQRPSRSITYIALGPLTNLAHMMRQDSNLVRENIGRVVSMGGALDVPGNTSPAAEFNFFADPFAVKDLLLPKDPNLGLPLDRVLLLPLDITTFHELPFSVYKNKIDSSLDLSSRPSVASGKEPLTHFTSAFLERAREMMLKYGKDAMELHDPAAVWCAIENPPSSDTLGRGWRARPRVFDIERTGELTRGMLVVDRRADSSAYSPGANRAEIQAELEKRAFQHGEWESTAIPAQVEVEQATEEGPAKPGVLCVHETPGPEALLNLLLQRIWGV